MTATGCARGVTVPSRLTPTQIPGATATQIDAVYNSTCLMLSNGAIRCYGGTLPTNASLSQLDHSTHISMAGNDGVCGLKTDGTIQCLQTVMSSPSPSPAGIVSFDSGDDHACALLNDNTVRCWGSPGYGNFGTPFPVGTGWPNNFPVTPMGLPPARQVSVGAPFSCVLLQDNTVRCFGNDDDCELGQGTCVSRDYPVAVAGLSQVQQISAGRFHACALRMNGTLACWGRNMNGQLGDGTRVMPSSPVEVLW